MRPALRDWSRLEADRAFHAGAALPPITVVQVGERYAIRDGHHRVSVARALGSLTISAVVV